MTTSDRTESTMYWHLQAFAVAVVLAAVAILGCSGDADADAGGPGDAGGDTVDANDAIIQEICPGACSTIKTCYAELAPGVCEDQCAKEVTGTGYLVKEIALIVFETVRDAESDPSCGLVYREGAFTRWWEPFSPIEDQATLGKCTQYREQCAGDGDHSSYCFFYYYRYNTSYRTQMDDCFKLDRCMDIPSCLLDIAPHGQPWFAGVPPKNDPF